MLLAEARRIHTKLIAVKTAKGYTPAAAGTPYLSTGNEGRDSGLHCQLLNPMEEAELLTLLDDDRYVLQEKFDGKRMMLRKKGSEVTGLNRRGLEISLPAPIAEAALQVPFDFVIDGEAIGDKLHAFDLLELKGDDLRSRSYMNRLARLARVLDSITAMCPVVTATDCSHKKALLQQLRDRGAEGVVLKDRTAAFSPGRPSTGGSQLKFKFVTTGSFIVSGINRKRSVALSLWNGTEEVPAGNVTIPPDQGIPAMREIVEVRYLYAFRESGSVYQPVYLGRRDDLEMSDCDVRQLKYKESMEQ